MSSVICSRSFKSRTADCRSVSLDVAHARLLAPVSDDSPPPPRDDDTPIDAHDVDCTGSTTDRQTARRQIDRHSPRNDLTFRGCQSTRRPCVRRGGSGKRCLPLGCRIRPRGGRRPAGDGRRGPVREMDASSSARAASSDGP